MGIYWELEESVSLPGLPRSAILEADTGATLGPTVRHVLAAPQPLLYAFTTRDE